ncbi:DUF2185 domain-containing protein [Clostridioides sp. ZZV15-6388]|uniref:immunity protein Imm33 domain-containing protein n=1 Tax=unclassified Clostridioides TaxID=2635829 RepID=UPI001D0FF704|nr:DUF2185 domain-containing protein [Clostridioides sp. ZZV15-6388]MCC0664343.1 DUF2185 domain-containing protein [Clostridioides sp. ZZV15-6597]
MEKVVYVFAINIIFNYDKDIIPYLHADVGSAYIRIDSNNFEIDDGLKEIFIHEQ